MHTQCMCAWSSVGVTSCSAVLERQINIRSYPDLVCIWDWELFNLEKKSLRYNILRNLPLINKVKDKKRSSS